MQIFIKTLDNKTITLQIKTTDAIKNIKHKIQNRENVPYYKQNLLYGITPLKNEFTIKDYNISDNSTLHLVTRPNSNF
jgi:hypothetical protein